jgi:hypothetical protein
VTSDTSSTSGHRARRRGKRRRAMQDMTKGSAAALISDDVCGGPGWRRRAAGARSRFGAGARRFTCAVEDARRVGRRFDRRLRTAAVYRLPTRRRRGIGVGSPIFLSVCDRYAGRLRLPGNDQDRWVLVRPGSVVVDRDRDGVAHGLERIRERDWRHPVGLGTADRLSEMICVALRLTAIAVCPRGIEAS